MDSTSLSREQLQQLAATNDRYLQWISALQRRMNRVSFPPGDELRQQVNRTRDQVLALRVKLHYLSCGVTASPNTTPPPMTGNGGGA